MRLNLRWVIAALAGVVLLGSGSPIASQVVVVGKDQVPENLSLRASTLLAQIQREAVGLRRHADSLRMLAKNNQYSWQSHAAHLDAVKTHINAVGARTAELQGIQHAVPSWKRQAIAEVTSHAAQVARSTEAAISQLNEDRNSLILAEYQGHLTTIADRSADMKEAVDKFLAYEKTQQKLHQLQTELELSGD